MKFLIFLTAIVGFATCSENISSHIVNGRDANIYEYPFMASVNTMGLFSCGGTIISLRSVLTAAHCIILSTSALVSVTVGSSRRQGQGGDSYRALRVIIHPDYFYQPDPFVLRNDVAVIRTLRTIRFGIRVQPLPLGRYTVPFGASVVIAGWGLTGDSFLRDRPDQMQQLNMEVMSNIACILRHIGTAAQGQVTYEKVCLTTEWPAGACGGDSGGPVIYDGTVVGIAAWTIRPCGTHPSVYTRVSEHYNWIEQQM